MIKSVTATNFKNESITLDLFRPHDSGLAIANIEGLGPPKANILSTNLATSDGSIFTSSRADNRNIVLTLIMMDRDMTIEEARLLTYKYFPIKREVTLAFKTDNRDVYIKGYVESNVPVIFSERVTTQISVICTDPYFYEVLSDETIFSGVQPNFEFPFENDSLSSNLLEMGLIKLDTRAILDYKGDADTGMIITIHALDIVRNVKVYNNDTLEMMDISTNKIKTITGLDFTAGDDIIISTVRGNKYARFLKSGKYTNVISAISKDSSWFQLTNGQNTFTFTAEQGQNSIVLSFAYHNAYGGI